ncbi:insulin-like peptide INSL5 [Carcharodon carcharias]|uniref:insulin-like peptide INSL5 n=1 Tax=Carcharodon carcharias TaxID=13397 RepID=UPI001B7E66CB|nr:insulin-like peptide INSL5 [Carcharodon carcharias]
MRALALAALLALILVLAVPRVRAQEVVRLCGHEFYRALLHQCGASRWKRAPRSEAVLKALLAPGDQKSPFTENSDFNSFQYLPADFSQRSASSSEEDLSYNPDLLKATLEAFLNPSRAKRSDNPSKIADHCCKRGCSKKQLNSIC